MGVGVLLVEVGAVEVRVHLQGGHVGVAQDLLQHAQIGAALQHVGGKRVAQGVGAVSYTHLMYGTSVTWTNSTLPGPISFLNWRAASMKGLSLIHI